MGNQIARRPLKDLRDFFDGNLAYLIAMLLLVIGSIVIGITNFDFDISAIVVELFAIAMPAVIFAFMRKRKAQSFLRINRVKPLDALLVVGIFLTAYPVGIFINYLVIMGLMTIGKITPPILPVPTGIGEFAMQLLSVAGSAALCEELLFRGFIMRSYEGLGWKKAILISAGLFSALHFSVENMAATFYLGLLLGYVVYKTNSIFAGMIGHFLNNSIAIVLNMTLKNLPAIGGVDIKNAADIMPSSSQMLVGVIFIGVIAVVMMAAQFGLISILNERALKRFNEKDFIGPVHEARTLGIKEFWPLIPATLIFLFFIVTEILRIVLGDAFKMFS